MAASSSVVLVKFSITLTGTPTSPRARAISPEVRITSASLALPRAEMVSVGIPLGKVYRVGDEVQALAWYNAGRFMRSIDCVEDLDRGGWLPVEVLDLPVSA